VDGGGDAAGTYLLKRHAYRRPRVGDVVEVRYSPRRQVLRGIKRVVTAG
jgi:hypothetical protein